MLHSTDRILTTHVGSLPRSEAVTEMVFRRGEWRADGTGGAACAAGRRRGCGRGETVRGRRGRGQRRRNEQDQLRHLHQGPHHWIRRRQPAAGAGRSRGVSGFSPASGRQRRHAHLSQAPVRRRNPGEGHGSAGGGPGELSRGGGSAQANGSLHELGVAGGYRTFSAEPALSGSRDVSLCAGRCHAPGVRSDRRGRIPAATGFAGPGTGQAHDVQGTAGRASTGVRRNCTSRR